MNLRPYQSDCQSAVERGWEQFDRQLVVIPTGGGKTIIFSKIARTVADAGLRTLVLVDQSELAFQTVDKMQRAAGLKCEVEKAEFSATLDSQVVVATVQTMARRLQDWPANHFGMVIADEADKSISKQWQSVLNHFDQEARVAGFTATPNRSDKRNLGEYYEAVAYEIGLFDLIRQGYLSPIVVKMLPIQIDLNSVRMKGGDFDAEQLHDAITPHLQEAAQAIRLHASFRKTLVFVPLIATSLKFVEICRSIGLAAEHIDGTSEDRAEKLRRFEAGEFDILVNSALLLRGVDIPPIDCVVMLRPTKSLTLYQQAIGRGTRLAEFKENLLLLDFLYDAEKKLVCRPAHLIARDEDEARAMTDVSAEGVKAKAGGGEQLTAFDLMGMQSVVQAQREKALRKKLEELKDRKSRVVSAEEFAIRHNNMQAAEYEPTMKWEHQPVTDKQAKYLKQAGIDIQTVRGKGHASQLLDIHFGNKKLELASPAAVSLMQRMHQVAAAVGIMSPEHATMAEQRRFFAELNRRRKVNHE